METNLYNKDWSEELPESCPDKDAHRAKGEIYYRLVKTFPATDEDFKSQRCENVTKVFSPEISECIAHSLSLYDDLDKAKRRLKTARFKRGNYKIAKVILYENDGVVKRTFKRGHNSWWKTKNYDISKANIVRL